MNFLSQTLAAGRFNPASLVLAGALALPVADAASVAAAEAAPPAVQVTVRLVQVDFERLRTIEAETGESIAPPEDWGVTFGIRLGAAGVQLKPPIFYLGDEGEVRIGDQTWRLGAAIDAADAGDDAAGAASPFTVLSAPRVLCPAGQSATLTIGEATPHLVLGANGALRLSDEAPPIEGVTISVTPTVEASGIIEINPIEVDLRRLVGREPIEGIPFDVGRPIFETHTSSRTIRLAPDDVAVMPMSKISADDKDTIMLVISAQAIEAGAAGQP